MQLVCDIYKGNKKEGMYLYVAQADGLTKSTHALARAVWRSNAGNDAVTRQRKKTGSGRCRKSD